MDINGRTDGLDTLVLPLEGEPVGPTLPTYLPI